MLPLLFLTDWGGCNGGRGENRCGSKDIVDGGEKRAGESLGDRFVELDDKPNNRSSISTTEESSISSSRIESGFDIVVEASLVLSFCDSGLLGMVDNLMLVESCSR